MPRWHLQNQRIQGHPAGQAVQLDIQVQELREKLIRNHDIVVSLLPPALHIEAAKACVVLRKSLVTASYTSPAIRQLDDSAKDAGITILNEMGLDPGIDHLSAMAMLDHIRAKGGHIHSFKSYCGGLVAPAFENNPWKYKFTWNPMNVVLAGQATAKYLDKNHLHFIPPGRIFSEIEIINDLQYGDFEGYANRDSLEYMAPYGLQDANTILRGTLRRKGYCEAWNTLVKLGYTDNTYTLPEQISTYQQLTSALLPPGNDVLRNRLSRFLGYPVNHPVLELLNWTGLESDMAIPPGSTPATALLALLEQKWKLEAHEQDMVIMIHEIGYALNGQDITERATLMIQGDDQTYTAMAKTVGLPLAHGRQTYFKRDI